MCELGLMFYYCYRSDIIPHSPLPTPLHTTLAQVRLPKPRRKTSRLHFSSGLTFDLFSVLNTAAGVNRVFGLPEFSWPNDKDATTVLSMLHHALELPENIKPHLVIHADNCGGYVDV